MSSISMDIPTLQINENELNNLVRFIYKNEHLLKEFGAIKIQPNIQCKLALKKRRKNLLVRPDNKRIVNMCNNKGIYFAQNVDHINGTTEQNTLIKDEQSFWSLLSELGNEQRPLNISLLPNKSFFSEKTSRLYFDVHRLPKQSLLQLGGNKVTRQFIPHVKRAHGPGSIFPMSSTRQRLFSIDYHHEGGAHHWYFIPIRERDTLETMMEQKNSSVCLDHGYLFIDPLVLEKNHIRFHRIIQYPNEFVVLSAGTLAQSFTEESSWSESIAFALPSWIEEGHANVPVPLCQCNIFHDSPSETTIDTTLFRHELIQRYITSYLNIIANDTSMRLNGS